MELDKLVLSTKSGREFVFPEALSNGRANYIIFESLIRDVTGFIKTSGSDHKDELGRRYEQKSYEDPDLYPESKDLFRCSSSSTFGANNHGPKIKAYIAAGEYEKALELCKSTGYNKNDFYIFTNTGGYKPAIPFRFFIVDKNVLVENLNLNDPRLISKTVLFNMLKSKVKIT
jgi:hypothetical protein